MESKGRSLHAQAAQAREREQFSESLTYNDDALFAYDEEGDALGFSEGIACRSITLRVYGNLHRSERILTLAKYEMLASVELARKSGIPEAVVMPLYNLAQVQEDLGELSDAVTSYRDAVSGMEKNPPEGHNRPSVIANMNVHLASCEYKAGDKTAIVRAESALRQLMESEEANTYNKDVWVSGGYMRMADAVRTDDFEKARGYMEKAREIIEANPELTLRKKQWDQLSESIQ